MSMTLEEAKEFITHGTAFGEVYPLVQGDVDRVRLKEWFVREASVPVRRYAPAPDSTIPFTYAGDSCSRCGGINFRQAGACKTCNDCGESQGCG